MVKKKILVDARSFSDEPVGVARYISYLIKELVGQGFCVELISNNSIVLPDILHDCNLKCHNHYFSRFIPGSLYIFILGFFFSDKDYVFWGPNHVVPAFGLKSLLTVHDIVMIRHPETMTFTNRFLNNIFLYLSLRFSSKISTVSEFTKKELLHEFRFINKKDITVVRNSVDKNLFNTSTKQHGVTISNKFILTVGTLEPRKNIDTVICAFINLVTNYGYEGDLVIVGKKGWLIQSFIDSKLDEMIKNKIKFTGYVSDSELSSYYNICDVFVFPSLYEGFGIPPLEAYCSGAKVIATSNSEMPYLNLNGMTIIDLQSEDLYNSLTLLLSLPKLPLPMYSDTWRDNALILSNLFEVIGVSNE